MQHIKNTEHVSPVLQSDVHGSCTDTHEANSNLRFVQLQSPATDKNTTKPRQEHASRDKRENHLAQNRKYPHAAKSMPDDESNHAHTQLNTRTPSSTTNREGMCSVFVVHTRPQSYTVTVVRFPRKRARTLSIKSNQRKKSIIQNAVTHER